MEKAWFLKRGAIYMYTVVIPFFPRYPEARRIKRKIIYHSGPTNSGKTHSAIERFKTAETGIYCGPLRLLATEVFQRTNDAVGIPFIIVIIIFTSWYNVNLAIGFRVWGWNSIKNHSFPFVRQLIYALSLD